MEVKATKVYIVTTGAYSSYRIFGVFLNKEKAKEAAATLNKEVKHYVYEAEVEEHDVRD